MEFSKTEESGKDFGFVCSVALTKISKFVIFGCVVSPLCHFNSFVHGFVKGFKEGNNIARTH